MSVSSTFTTVAQKAERPMAARAGLTARRSVVPPAWKKWLHVRYSR
jgi:hypothetical protein